LSFKQPNKALHRTPPAPVAVQVREAVRAVAPVSLAVGPLERSREPCLPEGKMSEILLHLGLAIIRFFAGLYEFFGFLFEADFYLANGFFSSKTCVAIRERIRHQKVA